MTCAPETLKKLSFWTYPMVMTTLFILLYINVNSVQVVLEQCKQDCGWQKGAPGFGGTALQANENSQRRRRFEGRPRTRASEQRNLSRENPETVRLFPVQLADTRRCASQRWVRHFRYCWWVLKYVASRKISSVTWTELRAAEANVTRLVRVPRVNSNLYVFMQL